MKIVECVILSLQLLVVRCRLIVANFRLRRFRKTRCAHTRLELRDYARPDGLRENDIWISNSSLICCDCGVYLMSSPDDVTRIVNIPHPAKSECTHPHEMCVHPLSGFGAWRCLQCGESGIASPTHKLEIN